MSIRIRVGVVLLKGDSFLLVRHQKEGRDYWLLPGGRVEENETLIQAAKREVKEEVSLEVKIGKLLFINDSISPKKSCHIVNFTFLGRIISGEVFLKPDERLKEARFVKVGELEKLTFYPNIKKFLIEAFLKNFELPPAYLGNLWEE